VTDFVFGAIGAYLKIPEIENPVDEILREYSNDIDLARIESFTFNIQYSTARCPVILIREHCTPSYLGLWT
jgi:hypothetical protein